MYSDQQTASLIPGQVLRNKWAFYLLLLLCLGFVQFWDARLFTWSHDDFDYLDHIRKSETDFWFLLSPNHISSGRPITTLFFLIGGWVWGENQVAHHLSLIFFHILAIWTLTWSLFRAGIATTTAMLAGVLFLFNVSHFTVPYWLSCFSYIGCLAFGSLAIASYLHYQDTRQTRHLILTSALILVATATHPAAAIFVGLMGYFAFRRGVPIRKILGSLWIPALICASLTAAFLFYYPNTVQNESVSGIADTSQVIRFTAAYLGRAYLSPYWLSESFTAGINTSDSFVGFFLIGVGVILLIYKRSEPLDAIVWSTLALPIFGGSTDTYYFPRYFYLASVGPSILYAWLLTIAAERILLTSSSWLRWSIPGLGLVLLLTSSYSHQRNTVRVWWASIGVNYMVTGKMQEGLGLLRESILAAPQYMHQNLYTQYGREAVFFGIDAGDILDLGAQYYPASDRIRLLRETVHSVTDRRPVTREFVDQIREVDEATISLISATLNNAGSRQFNDGDYKLAEVFYASALLVTPNYSAAITRYGNSLLQQGKFPEATIAYERIFQLGAQTEYPRLIPGLETILLFNPDLEKPRHLLTIAYALSGKLDEAVRQTEEALAIDPGSKTYREEYAWLAGIYREQGDSTRADAILSQLKAISAIDLQHGEK